MRGRRVDGRDGENEAKSVFAVQIKAEETLLTNKSERFVKRQGCLIVVFCLQDYLRD
jgi:hypothetical protein